MSTWRIAGIRIHRNYSHDSQEKHTDKNKIALIKMKNSKKHSKLKLNKQSTVRNVHKCGTQYSTESSLLSHPHM